MTTDMSGSADEQPSGLRVANGTGEVVVVTVDVELDMNTAAPLTRLLTKQLDAGHRLLIVDLSMCEFLGSPGLAALVEVDGLARRDGTAFAVVGCNQTLLRTITVTGLNTVLDIYPSTQEAAAALITE